MGDSKRVKLTEKTIQKMRYEGAENSRDVRWDMEVHGFGVRIYPSGRKAFILSYRFNNRKRFLTIGDCSDWRLEKAPGRRGARNEARELKVGIDKGIDPLQRREDARKAGTVKELVEDFIETHCKPHKKSWEKDERRLERFITPKWGNLKAHAITKADVAALHRSIGRATPYEANRVLEVISGMFHHALAEGYIPVEKKSDWVNPGLAKTKRYPNGIQRFEEKSRDRYVLPEEMPRLIDAIEEEDNPYIKAAIWLYLLAGPRKNELLKAKRSDLDSKRGILRLYDIKSDSYDVQLSSHALTILADLPQDEGNPYLFPSPKKPGEPLVNIDKSWQRIKKAAKLNDVRIHDLRRTVGSWLANSNVSLNIIGKALGHKSQSATLIYARLQDDPVKAAVEAHGKQIMGVAKRKSADVVKVR